MLSKKVVKEIMKDEHYSQQALADKLNDDNLDMNYTQSHITGILNRHNSMQVEKLVLMCEAMGYEVIVRNKTKNKDLYKEYKLTDGKESYPENEKDGSL